MRRLIVLFLALSGIQVSNAQNNKLDKKIILVENVSYVKRCDRLYQLFLQNKDTFNLCGVKEYDLKKMAYKYGQDTSLQNFSNSIVTDLKKNGIDARLLSNGELDNLSSKNNAYYVIRIGWKLKFKHGGWAVWVYLSLYNQSEELIFAG